MKREAAWKEGIRRQTVRTSPTFILTSKGQGKEKLAHIWCKNNLKTYLWRAISIYLSATYLSSYLSFSTFLTSKIVSFQDKFQKLELLDERLNTFIVKWFLAIHISTFFFQWEILQNKAVLSSEMVVLDYKFQFFWLKVIPLILFKTTYTVSP